MISENGHHSCIRKKMKMCYDRYYGATGVVIGTQRRRYVIHLLPYFLALGSFHENPLLALVPPLATSMFVKFKHIA